MTGSLETTAASSSRQSRAATGSGALPPAVSPLRARRRPAMIALAVALIALGGGTGAWLLSRSGETMTVLVMAEEVARGEVITATDLTTSELPVNTLNLQVVPYDELGLVVGQVATVDLTTGALLGPDAFAEELVPAAGDSIVGVALTTAQLPSIGLSAGDSVRFVATPQQGGELPVAEPAVIEAQVINVASTDTGVLVNVQVTSDQAPALAAMAATTRIALILDPVS